MYTANWLSSWAQNWNSRDTLWENLGHTWDEPDSNQIVVTMQPLLFDLLGPTLLAPLTTRSSHLAVTPAAVPTPYSYLSPTIRSAAAHPPTPYQAARAPLSRSTMRTFSIPGIVHEYDHRPRDGAS